MTETATTDLNAVEPISSIEEIATEEVTEVDSTEVAIDVPSDEIPQDDTTKVPSDMEISDEYVVEYKAAVDQMNFIEVSGAVSYLNNQLKAIQQSKSMLDTIGGSKEAFEELASKINGENILSTNDVSASIDDFYKNYDNSVLKLEELLQYAEAKAREFDGVEKTSSYITTTMLDYIEKCVDHESINYKVSKEVISNRTKVDWLCAHITNARILTRRMQQYVKKSKVDAVKNVQHHVATSLQRSPALKHQEALAAFNAYLKERAGFTEAETFYFMYALSCTYEVALSKKTGIHKWIDVLFMNVLDIIGGRYDLEGGEELVNENLHKIKDALGIKLK